MINTDGLFPSIETEAGLRDVSEALDHRFIASLDVNQSRQDKLHKMEKRREAK